jgi:hypothetical protein
MATALPLGARINRLGAATRCWVDRNPGIANTMFGHQVEGLLIRAQRLQKDAPRRASLFATTAQACMASRGVFITEEGAGYELLPDPVANLMLAAKNRLLQIAA